MNAVGPVAHIPRRGLPWRKPELTECGKALTEYPPERIISLAEVQRLVRDVGAQRASFGLCMTCCSTRDALSARRWSGANEDAVQALQRECSAVQHATPPMPTGLRAALDDRNRDRAARSDDVWTRKQRLVGELEAIQALVDAHREEFDGYLVARADAPSLTERRSKRRRRSS